MTKLLGTALLLGRLIAAQGVDSLLLIDNQTARIAADSQGNLVTLQQTAVAGFCGTGCVAPDIRNVYAVYRYDSQGQLLQTLNGISQVVDAAGRIDFLTLDSSDNIYVGADDANGNAILLRPSDTPSSDSLNPEPWKPAISGAALNLQGLAFDPRGNPVALASDSNTGHMQVVKLDRVSGQILAAYSFASSSDFPSAVATDNAGAVYIAGATSSPDFPLTSGAWPASCTITVANGRYDCQQAFVTKLDPGLQRVVYSSLLSADNARAIAVAGDGSAYVGGSPGFLVKLNPQGSVVASSSAFPGGVADLKLDSSGNAIAIGSTASGSACGPDRANLGGSPPAAVVTSLDSQLAGILSSAVIPQQDFRGPSALLADGTLYMAVQPSQTTQEFSGITFPGTRVLHVSPGKPPTPVSCIVNGASLLVETAVAPGQLLTIFGQGLGSDPGVALDATQQLPFAAQGTSVDIGGLAAPLLYVSAHQINATVPYGIKLGSQATIGIRRNGSVVYTWTMDTVTQNPTPLLSFGANGLAPDDQNQPVVPLADAVNEDGTPNSQQNPAHTGSVVTVYATGYGQLTPAVADGAPGAIPSAVSNGAGIQSRFGILQPVSVATIPGWNNAVVAVKFQVPNTGLPGIADLVFRLAPPVTSQNIPVTFIYVTQ